MLARRQTSPRPNLLRHGAAWAALAASLLAAPTAFAQDAPAAPAGGAASPPTAGGQAPLSQQPVARTATQTGVPSFADSMIPGFQFTAALNLSETYSTNS